MATIDMTRLTSNIAALNSLKSLQDINNRLAIHQERLATGKRINNAGDDPAGLTIATKMLARSEGLKVALNNVGDAKNLIAVAEAGMGRINDILVQMRNKAEQAASDTLGVEERTAVVTQLNELAAQVDDIVKQTKWNGKQLLDGLQAFGGSLTFQTGADKGDTTVLAGLANMSAAELGLVETLEDDTIFSDSAEFVDSIAFTSGAENIAYGSYTIKATFTTEDSTTTVEYQVLDSEGNEIAASESPAAPGDIVLADQGITIKLKKPTADGDYTHTFTAAEAGVWLKSENLSTTLTGSSSAADFATFMDDVNAALNIVSNEMTKIGSLTSRLTFKEDQITAAQINTEAAYNRIISANMAEEQVNASKYQILQQTATAMLAQANAAPQFLLSLFR